MWAEVKNIIGSIEGNEMYLINDMIDTAGTITFRLLKPWKKLELLKFMLC